MCAAGIVFEPSPENFQLTTVGEQVVEMVFWGAWRASTGAPELRQRTWSGPPTPDLSSR
jgi:hypothetical protein